MFNVHVNRRLNYFHRNDVNKLQNIAFVASRGGYLNHFEHKNLSIFHQRQGVMQARSHEDSAHLTQHPHPPSSRLVNANNFVAWVYLDFAEAVNHRFLSSLSSVWTWSIKWDLPINPNMCSYLTVGCLFPIKPPLSAVNTRPTVSETRAPARHYIHLLNALLTCTEYNKAIAIYGPPFILRTIQSSLYPHRNVPSCDHTWSMQ